MILVCLKMLSVSLSNQNLLQFILGITNVDNEIDSSVSVKALGFFNDKLRNLKHGPGIF